MENDPVKNDDIQNLEVIVKALEYTVDPIALLEAGRRFIFCNRAWKVYHGLDPDVDMRGLGLETIKSEEIQPLFIEGREALDRGESFEREFHASWCDKRVKIIVQRIEVSGRPVTVVVIRDITDIIKKSEERIRSRFMGVPVPIYIWRHEGDDMILVDYNEAAFKITGGRVVKLVGKTAAELHAGHPGILEEMWRCYNEHVPIVREMEYRSYFGDKSWWMAVKYVYAEPDLVIVHTEDITERVTARKELEKYRDTLEAQVRERTARLAETNAELERQIHEKERTEKALRRSEERYRSVTELASDYMYAGKIYPDLTVKRDWVAGAFEKITGYRPDEIECELGHPDILHPDDRGIAVKHLEDFIAGRSVDSEFRIITKSGELRWIHSFGVPGERGDDGGIRVVGAVKDITGRKLFEIALEKRNRELGLLNRLNDILQSSNDTREAVKMVLDIFLKEFGIKAAGAWVLSDDGGCFERVASVGVPRELHEPFDSLPVDDIYVARAIREGRPVVFEDEMPVRDPKKLKVAEELNVISTVAVPVVSGGVTKVLFNFGFERRLDESAGETAYLQLIAGHLGLGLERLELLKAEKIYEEKVKKLAGKLIQTIEEDKSRIARNLHDDIGQSIIVLIAELAEFEKTLPPGDAGTIERCKQVRMRLNDLAGETRRVAYSLALQPAMLEDLGLIPALQWYIDTVVEPGGIEVDLAAAGFDEMLPSRQAVALYRVAQEALTNAMRHSGAKKVQLKLIKGYPNIIMDIKDRGRGFPMKGAGAPGDGLGITGMRERIQNIDGTFDIQSAPGKGTRVRVTLPVEECDEQ
ncbi:MAG: PAS domain S-box protein [Candidatus Krumholzibacteria bacterium]|jgi:PAS domain S-box-containing protein|nr:PAS domain S-box protein [Candidatus Krumholzibacteria bacterium]